MKVGEATTLAVGAGPAVLEAGVLMVAFPDMVNRVGQLAELVMNAPGLELSQKVGTFINMLPPEVKIAAAAVAVGLVGGEIAAHYVMGRINKPRETSQPQMATGLGVDRNQNVPGYVQRDAYLERQGRQEVRGRTSSSKN